MMVASKAHNQRMLHDLHDAALAAGGFDKDQPGCRDVYRPQFYSGCLRNLHGNKIALFSADYSEPGCDG